MTLSVFASPERWCCWSILAVAALAWRFAFPKWPRIAAGAKLLAGGALACLIIFPWRAAAQDMARDEAKTEAETLAQSLEEALRNAAAQQVDAQSVPGFVAADPGETAHYANPEGLQSAGLAGMAASGAGKLITDSLTARPTVTAEELETWTANGLSIEADARSIVTEYGGAYGDCTTAIMGGAPAAYAYSCNEGETLQEFSDACTVSLSVSLTASYKYAGREIFDEGSCRYEPDPDLALIQNHEDCGPLEFVNTPSCAQDGNRCGVDCSAAELEAVCASAIPGLIPVEEILSLPGTDMIDASACAAMENNSICSFLGETCVEPAETRLIGGVAVARDCWKWERAYSCASLGGGVSDCAPPAGCTLTQSACLSSDEETGECRSWEHSYQCETEGPSGGAVGYCEEDVYCIDGDCETLRRPQSEEFHQAISALSLLGQLEDDADPEALAVFPGEYGKCDKAVAGLQNCCKNDGLLTDIGFACSAEDRALAQQIEAGLCHYNGVYCSDKTLFGICLKKRKTYCCFDNVLARLIHEQGRAQVGLDWGEVKEPDCAAFTVALFQQLDLSIMDFSEFYNDVLAGYAPPDGAAAADAIAQRIIDAYQCPENC